MRDTRAVFKELVNVGFLEKQAEAFLYGYNKPLNTLVFYRKLIESGFTEEQAELIVELSWKENYGNKQYYKY
jgi:hypothetical protein